MEVKTYLALLCPWAFCLGCGSSGTDSVTPPGAQETREDTPTVPKLPEPLELSPVDTLSPVGADPHAPVSPVSQVSLGEGTDHPCGCGSGLGVTPGHHEDHYLETETTRLDLTTLNSWSKDLQQSLEDAQDTLPPTGLL